MGALAIILTTLPEKEAKKIKEALIKEKLAACILEISTSSMYLWKNRIEKAGERLLVIKTLPALLQEAVKRLKELHPYEVPFIFAMTGSVNDSYLKWAEKELKEGRAHDISASDSQRP